MEAGQKAGSLDTGGNCESNQVKALIPIASLLYVEAFLSSEFYYEYFGQGLSHRCCQ